MADRGVAPVLGVVLLVGVTVGLGVAVAAAVPPEPAQPAPTVSLGLEADVSGEVRLTHRGGDALDPEALRVRVTVDGDALAEQPPVPFFSAHGFESGPTGAFNSATTGTWRAGETASFTVAATNSPTLSTGATVRVRLYSDGGRVADVTTTV